MVWSRSGVAAANSQSLLENHMSSKHSGESVHSDESGPTDEHPEEHQPQSRAERRAAARGRVARESQHPWGTGKIAHTHGPAPARRQYSNRRSGS
jgi:hypothetical protein